VEKTSRPEANVLLEKPLAGCLGNHANLATGLLGPGMSRKTLRTNILQPTFARSYFYLSAFPFSIYRDVEFITIFARKRYYPLPGAVSDGKRCCGKSGRFVFPLVFLPRRIRDFEFAAVFFYKRTAKVDVFCMR